MAWEGNGSWEQLDWSGWIKGLGKQARRVREFLGLSQEQVARVAGVSQGACPPWIATCSRRTRGAFCC
jgi:hypothetical protein